MCLRRLEPMADESMAFSESSIPEKGVPDLVIQGGTVLTMIDGQRPMEGARILIKDGIIVGLLEKGAEETLIRGSPELIDARDSIIMPGLINAHTHAGMSLFRGMADDLPLREWLFEKIFPAEAKFLKPETVRWGALLGCLEMIASGTTCFVDGYFYQDETVLAAHQAGLRGLVAQGVIDFPAPGVENPKENLSTAKTFIEKWKGFSELIRPGIFCHSPVTCSEETLRRAWALSEAFDLPFQIHLSETSEEVIETIKKTGQRPVPYLDRIGLVQRGLIAAHAIHLEDREMDLLQEKGVRVVHVPESNMKLCSGVAKVSEMMKRGMVVGIGTDGCASNNNLDLFQEMDIAAKLSKVFTLDPVSLNARTVLKMATSFVAVIAGFGTEVGTLEVGKKADLAVIDANSPQLTPIYDPFSALVYSASGADVRDVIVNGRVLMKNRRFMTLDSEEIMANVRRISRSIVI
jgi:5-methylthioadenosine/S-adenosylhomocysteine deaminase